VVGVVDLGGQSGDGGGLEEDGVAGAVGVDGRQLQQRPHGRNDGDAAVDAATLTLGAGADAARLAVSVGGHLVQRVRPPAVRPWTWRENETGKSDSKFDRQMALVDRISDYAI